ncbi:MAG TPA: hypothetical protein VIQ30_22360 [Pseudonocardia sp.]|jgi:hypothetical protein
MSPTRVIPRIPVASRIVLMMVTAVLAVAALASLPDASAPQYSTVAVVNDTSPAAPVSAGKCKKKCKKRYDVRDADLKYLRNGDVGSVAVLGTVLAVVALAAVI